MSKRADWWYSPDERTGFSWRDVVGYDWHPANGGTALSDYIYVYLGSGILRISGANATAVHAELITRKAKSL